MQNPITLTKISKIEDNIFLSGVIPMELDTSSIKRHGITHILCCVSKQYVSDVHHQVMVHSPNVVILYLPYDDDAKQNLWKKNSKSVTMKYLINSTEAQSCSNNIETKYEGKPLIDIGYHFMDNALQNDNHKILVHCMAGISRSVSLVIYYKMKKNNIKYHDAYTHVKNLRSIAQPNMSFKDQLIAYDKDRENFTETDADKIIKTKY